MQSVASKMSHNVAKFAVTAEKQLHVAQENTSQPFALIAVKKQKFRSSQKQTDLYTAVTALQSQEKINSFRFYEQ